MQKSNIYTREQLCELIKISNSSLRKYISRGTIKEVQKGFIDVGNELNKEYLINYMSKKGLDYTTVFGNTIELVDEVIQPEIQTSEKKIQITKLAYTVLRDEKLQKEVEKINIETKLKILEFDKKKSKIVPVDFAGELINRYLKGTCGSIINNGNSLIELICDENDLDTAIKLKYKKALRTLINETIKSKHKPVCQEINKYAKEYSLLNKW